MSHFRIDDAAGIAGLKTLRAMQTWRDIATKSLSAINWRSGATEVLSEL